MSIRSAAATAIAVAVLLSGCAPSSTPTTRSGSPSPAASHPAFMSADQDQTDRLPGGVADTINITPDSTRFQGNWDGRQIFLGVRGTNSVCLVTGFASDAGSWNAGCGNVDGVVTDRLPDGGTVKYLPMATSAAPEGWTRISDFVFVM